MKRIIFLLVLFNAVLSLEANTLTLQLSINDYNEVEFQQFGKFIQEGDRYGNSIKMCEDVLLSYKILLGKKYTLDFISQIKLFQERTYTSANKQVQYFLFFLARFTSQMSKYSSLSIQFPARSFPAYGYWDHVEFLLCEEETFYYEFRKERIAYHVGIAFGFAIFFQFQYHFCRHFKVEYGNEIRYDSYMEFIPLDLSYHRFGMIFNIENVECHFYFQAKYSGAYPYRIAINLGASL